MLLLNKYLLNYVYFLFKSSIQLAYNKGGNTELKIGYVLYKLNRAL